MRTVWLYDIMLYNTRFGRRFQGEVTASNIPFATKLAVADAISTRRKILTHPRERIARISMILTAIARVKPNPSKGESHGR